MNVQLSQLGAVGLGGGEIILLVFLLCVLAVLALGFCAVVYAIIRAVQNRPAPSQLTPELQSEVQHRKDREHLKLLAIFHFVIAGLALLGIAFVFVHYAVMHSMFSNPEMWKSQKQAMPPKEFLDMFIWFYIFMGTMLLGALILNALSGVFISRRRYRMFSLIIAGLDCVQIPFGTALGVFTILILSRDTVRELYESTKA